MTNVSAGSAQSKKHKKIKSRYYYQQKSKDFVIAIFRYALIICLAYMILFPLLQMLATVIKHPLDVGSPTSQWVPETLDFSHIIIGWVLMNYPSAFVLTITSTVLLAIFQMANAALAGYAFARLKFKGSGFLFGLIMLTIIMPPTSIMIPQYIMFRNFDIFGIFTAITGDSINMLGSPVSLYIMAAFGQGIKAGLFVYIFRQFFRGLPKELEEASYVDGAGFLKTFIRIVLPSAKPGFVTVGVLSFVWNWNDGYFKRLFHPTGKYLVTEATRLATNSAGGESNVQKAISELVSKFPSNVTYLYSPPFDQAVLRATQLLTIFPLIIFFAIIQKQFIEGVERSGIVG